ncbi:hypothetical protein [Erythrobacter rubeus]|uniref:Rod shape-determining protein MreD n=1 Tax=Erythrobacter rubeus TaxID=2760803 RepID=A0ABR8KKN7_9SPHN|nr:hypothetical protein [Erythrobacter rubeus]MBD2840805.1 hypothetical protein [Erythrobacter rubeus]
MLEVIFENRALAQQFVSILLGLAMLRWGGAPERAVACVFVGLLILPIVVIEAITGDALIFAGGGVYFATMDTVTAIAFTMIALYANRNYTLWIAGFQVVAASAHAVRFAVDVVTPLAHAVLVIGPSYFQIILMALGLFRHIRRKKLYGEYRDWRVPIRFPFGPGNLAGPAGKNP